MNVITSGTDIIKRLPSGEKFNIETLDGWDDLSGKQRAYLHAYMDTIGQENMARLSLGLKQNAVDAWATEAVFKNCIEIIDDLFTDGLRALDYLEAVTNGKIRGRVLQARKAKGYEHKSNPRNTLIAVGTGGLGGIMKALGQSTVESESTDSQDKTP
jgi:hypothetical protein